MQNNLDQIYERFGSNICLFPYLAGFYETANNSSIRPCSLIEPANWSIQNDSIMQSLNKDLWVNLRKNFNGNTCHTTDLCKKCSQAEINGGHSARKLNNQYFSEHLNIDIIDHVNRVISADYKVSSIVSLDFFPSNYCNYECIMCDGSASSRRRTFEIKILGYQSEKIANNELTNDFYNILQTVEIINFAGGESIMQKQVHEVIDYLIKQDLAKNITITLLTNASSYPNKLVEKFKQFKNVFYTISIDGVGAMIEYQRRGAEWTTVESNALQLLNDWGCVVNHVLTAVNIFRFTEFIKWVSEHNIDKVFISLVFNKDYLSVAVIPADLKLQLIDEIEKEKNTYSNQYYIGLFDQVINILKTINPTPELLYQFVETIKVEDSVSDKRLIEIVPEWAPYFNG